MRLPSPASASRTCWRPPKFSFSFFSDRGGSRPRRLVKPCGWREQPSAFQQELQRSDEIRSGVPRLGQNTKPCRVKCVSFQKCFSPKRVTQFLLSELYPEMKWRGRREARAFATGRDGRSAPRAHLRLHLRFVPRGDPRQTVLQSNFGLPKTGLPYRKSHCHSFNVRFYFIVPPCKSNCKY